jgi:hypothetical protein
MSMGKHKGAKSSMGKQRQVGGTDCEDERQVSPSGSHFSSIFPMGAVQTHTDGTNGLSDPHRENYPLVAYSCRPSSTNLRDSLEHHCNHFGQTLKMESMSIPETPKNLYNENLLLLGLSIQNKIPIKSFVIPFYNEIRNIGLIFKNFKQDCFINKSEKVINTIIDERFIYTSCITLFDGVRRIPQREKWSVVTWRRMTTRVRR